MLAFLLIFESDYVKLFTLRKWAMFNLKNIFNEKSGEKVSKNTSSSFLGDGKAILDAVDDGVLAVDQKGNILAINPAAEQITGWSGSDAAGLVFNSVLKITNNDGAEMLDISNPVNRVLRTNENFTTRDLFIKTQSGKITPIFLAVNSIGGSNSGVVVVFRDISKELIDNREQAEFISTASHEMRTPVASIEGYLGLALNPATATIDARAKSFLEKAHENTQHLGQLFQDLLDITKAEDGRLKNEPIVLDATEFARDIWEGLKPKAENKGLEYVFMPDHNATGEKTIMPVFFIHADRDHLHEVLNNLFENAIKYTPSGTVAVNVTGDNDSVQISVKDSGIGIPAEDLPHLFQKFYRVDNSETREINGTGLGLFLSRKLTESIGGKLTVESEYKKGSVFTVKLPRITRENAESLKAKEDAKKSEEHQKIEQKRNQREIEEADRDINAILQDETMEHPNIEAVNNQPTTALTEPTTPENPKETENLQTQPMQTQEVLSIPTIQAVSQPQPQPQPQEPAQSVQPISQPVQSAQPTQPIAQNVAQVQTQQAYNQQTTQTIQQAQRSAEQQDFVKYGAIRGFNPLAQQYASQPAQSVQPIPQPVQSAQPTQPIAQNVAQVQTQQAYNQQTTQTIQQTNPSAASQNFSQTNPVNTPVQPTLNDIERMKIEYAQKMMAQRQK